MGEMYRRLDHVVAFCFVFFLKTARLKSAVQSSGTNRRLGEKKKGFIKNKYIFLKKQRRIKVRALGKDVKETKHNKRRAINV